jgi:hypothetical protein
VVVPFVGLSSFSNVSRYLLASVVIDVGIPANLATSIPYDLSAHHLVTFFKNTTSLSVS